jgi:nucleotide-binding universal stress UspA family protein
MKLIVGYLATSGGADAVTLGVRLARTLGAELELRLVLASDEVAVQRVTSDRYQDVLAEQASEWLADALRQVPDDVTARGEITVDGSVARALVAEAERVDAQAIVVGGSGGGLAGRLSLGAAVDELLHSAPVPVAVAPRDSRHSDAKRIRRVTCAIGERRGADRLLDTAVQVSSATGAPLRLLSLVALDQHGGHGVDAAREHARVTLDTVKAALPKDVDVTVAVADGATIEDAVQSLDWQDDDLLMLGSSRLAPPRRLAIGSTAAKILRVLRVPMMVTPGEDSPEPV